MRHGDPVLVGYVKAVVVLVDGGCVAPENDDFVAVGDHVMEGASLGQCFFSFGRVELYWQFSEGIVVFAAAVT